VTLDDLRAWRPANARNGQRKAKPADKAPRASAKKSAADPAETEPEEETI